MRYIYKNITEETKILTLLSEDKASVSSVPLGPGARLEISNANLDIYVPHILARIDEHGNDISHLILRAAEDAAAKAPVVEAPVVKDEPVVVPVVLPVVTDVPAEAAETGAAPETTEAPAAEAPAPSKKKK